MCYSSVFMEKAEMGRIVLPCSSPPVSVVPPVAPAPPHAA